MDGSDLCAFCGQTMTKDPCEHCGAEQDIPGYTDLPLRAQKTTARRWRPLIIAASMVAVGYFTYDWIRTKSTPIPIPQPIERSVAHPTFGPDQVRGATPEDLAGMSAALGQALATGHITKDEYEGSIRFLSEELRRLQDEAERKARARAIKAP